ncbi:MAG TPA: SPASM domain-containing protein [Candidatus Deferrimicrobium sp.]|nr:SPASM domain-containing protein [Candidatus Deferrimicrobium sp.]
MKWSKYNYMFPSDKNDYFLYNSLSNSFVQLDRNAYKQMLEIKKDIENFDFSRFPGLQEKLIEAKIIIENDLDEFYRVKLTKHLKRYDRTGMSLTVAPTLDCNFNCSYCYEASRPPVYMSPEIEDKLIDFVKNFPECKNLYVTWYGGEALLAFDRILRLTEQFKKLDVIYYAGLITNGYEMTADKVDQFGTLRINHIHITIDGLEEVHNRRRLHLKNKDSFAVIQKNLDYLMEKKKEFSSKIVIRVNIDRSNENDYGPLYQYLRKRYAGHDFVIYPGFVNEKFGACNSAPDELLDRQMKADFTIRQFKEYGITGLNFFPGLSKQECMARHINSYLVAPNGDLFKCWTDIGVKEKAVGNLNQKGGLNNTILTRYLTGADPFDEPKCQRCFYLPICEGRCPHFALKNKFENAQIDLCHISKGNLKEFLQYHYHIRTANKAGINQTPLSD